MKTNFFFLLFLCISVIAYSQRKITRYDWASNGGAIRVKNYDQNGNLTGTTYKSQGTDQIEVGNSSGSTRPVENCGRGFIKFNMGPINAAVLNATTEIALYFDCEHASYSPSVGHSVKIFGLKSQNSTGTVPGIDDLTPQNAFDEIGKTANQVTLATITSFTEYEKNKKIVLNLQNTIWLATCRRS